MGFGSDFSALLDVDRNLTFLEGDKGETRALLQAVVRRITMPRGALFYAPGDCIDIRDFVSDVIDPESAAAQLENEIRKEERVDTVAVRITADGETWIVDISITASTGKAYALTLSVTKITVAILKGG